MFPAKGIGARLGPSMSQGGHQAPAFRGDAVCMGSLLAGGQKTLKQRVSLSGIGVHSGEPAVVSLCPAPAGNGITFLRTNLPGSEDVEFSARLSSVRPSELCTVVGDPAGICVSTVEHLLAALAGLGVDNAVIEIDGAEVPVMDGSAAPFVAAIDQAGIVDQKAPRRFIRVEKPVRVALGSAWAEFRPCRGRRFEVAIDYPCPVIGKQAIGLELTAKSFRKEVARARTFGYMRDVERFWAAGYALGSSLENSVAIGDRGVVNPEGLRFPDEFVRHKLLDAVGDLALAGFPIQGLYRSFKGGHRLNAMALSALLEAKDAWSLAAAPAAREPGREGRVELLAGVLAPVFAPEAS